MTDWAAAGAVIAAAFADPEPIIYSCDQGELTIPAIRSNMPDESGTERIAYEVQAADVPAEPSKRNSFVHRGRIWRPSAVRPVEGVPAWSMIVEDEGPAR